MSQPLNEKAPENRGKASSPSSGCGTTDHDKWRRTAPTLESDGTAQTVGEVLANLKAGTPLAEIVAEVKKKSFPGS